MEPVPSFAQLLRRHRRAAGLTQEELAERAGVSWRAISDLERGVYRAPRRDTLALLVEALALAGDDRAALEAAARRSSRLPHTVPVVTMPRPAEAYPSPVARVAGSWPDGLHVDPSAGGPALPLPRGTYPGAQPNNRNVAARESSKGTRALSTLSFGGALRRYRVTAGLSREMLAERSSLSPEAVRALERGQLTAPRAASLTLLAAALGLSPAEHAALAAAADASLAVDPEDAGTALLPDT